MPITREEFDNRQIRRDQHILSILRYDRDKAYSRAELLDLLNFRRSGSEAEGSLDLVRRAGWRPSTTATQLDQVLASLSSINLISAADIEGETYYTARLP